VFKKRDISRSSERISTTLSAMPSIVARGTSDEDSDDAEPPVVLEESAPEVDQPVGDEVIRVPGQPVEAGAAEGAGGTEVFMSSSHQPPREVETPTRPIRMPGGGGDAAAGPEEADGSPPEVDGDDETPPAGMAQVQNDPSMAPAAAESVGEVDEGPEGSAEVVSGSAVHEGMPEAHEPPPVLPPSFVEPEFVPVPIPPPPPPTEPAPLPVVPDNDATRGLAMVASIAMVAGAAVYLVLMGAKGWESAPVRLQLALAVPLLGGLLALVASSVRVPVSMRLLVLCAVGAATTAGIAMAEIAPLSDLGTSSRLGLYSAAVLLPVGLFWRSRSVGSKLSMLCVLLGCLAMVGNYAVVDLYLGDAGQTLAVTLVDRAGNGVSGGVVAGVAAVPLLMVLPSLWVLVRSGTPAGSGIWAGVLMGWTLAMPIVVGVLAIQSSGEPRQLIPYIGAGLLVFAAVAMLTIGLGEALGRATREAKAT
jgi:hypothetical protein